MSVCLIFRACSLFVKKDEADIDGRRGVQLYAPLNLTEDNKPSFSFSTVDSADSYSLEIFDAKSDTCIRQIETEKTFITTSSMEALLPGNYYFMVTPFKESLQVAPQSEPGFFTVSDRQLSSEIILGRALDSPFSTQAQPLILPECAVIGPDEAVYISNTFSHTILRVKDGISEPFLGSFVIGDTTNCDRLSVKINAPTSIVFDSNNMYFNDTGNSKIKMCNLKTGMVTTLFEYKGYAKSLQLLDNKIIVCIENSPSILVYGIKENILDKREINLPGIAELKDIAILGNVIYMLGTEGTEVDSPHKLIQIINNKKMKSIDIENFTSDLTIINGKLYVGEHTALSEVSSEMKREYIGNEFANITYLSQGRSENEILVTDSDAGTVFFFDLLSKEKTTVAGGTNRVGYISNMCEYGEWLYCLDNQSAQIWKYNKNTQIVQLFAGNGAQQLALLGEDKLKSSFFYPVGIAVDNAGNVFVGEQHHILKIDAMSGKISLFAGAPDRNQYGYAGDGDIAVNALFQSIRDLYYDRENDVLYVADTYNDAIRKISKDGVVSTLPITKLNKPCNINMRDNVLFISNSWSNEIITFDLDTNNQEYFAGVHNPTKYQNSGHRKGEIGGRLELPLNTPGGLDFMNDKVFFCDTFNSRVMMAQGENLKTVIGAMAVGYNSGDDQIINFPTCVLADEKYLYVADASNYILRRYKLSTLDFTFFQ